MVLRTLETTNCYIQLFFLIYDADAFYFTFQDQGDGTYAWLNSKPPYSCSIASPKKETKLKGLKSFIAYQLTPSVSTKKLDNT